MKFRTPHTRLLLGTVAALLISACDDSTESSPARSHSELELELQRAQQSLAQSRQALTIAEEQLLSLRGEQGRDRRHIADLTARAVPLERQNRDMGEQLAQLRGQLAQSGSVQRALREQSDQNGRQARELGIELQGMRERLAGAYTQIRQLQARQVPDPRQIGELQQRGAAAAREIHELRRYNGFLLQERSNLQAWLQEANANRNGQQEAVRRSLHEADRVKSDAEASNQKLQAQLETANQSLAKLETSRDTLAEEAQQLRTTLSRATESERERSRQLEKALAHASTLADANQRMASELQQSLSTPDQPGSSQAGEVGDAGVLHAELEQATQTIARLRAANSYLVEKVEACAPQKRSSLTESLRRVENPARPRLIAVATATDEEPKGNRRDKELNEVKAKLKQVQLEQKELAKKLAALEAENAAAKKQVQTLTWANEVLVKELDAAYAGRQAGSPVPLPKGSRGIYVLREGESLSRVAKAFYGEAERWKDIVAANKDKIPDPDRVKAGTVIVIPE
jgi:rootletin